MKVIGKSNGFIQYLMSKTIYIWEFYRDRFLRPIEILVLYVNNFLKRKIKDNNKEDISRSIGLAN